MRVNLRESFQHSKRQRIRLEAQVDRLNIIDPLTGCFNRSELYRRHDQELRMSERARCEPVSLVLRVLICDRFQKAMVKMSALRFRAGSSWSCAADPVSATCSAALFPNHSVCFCRAATRLQQHGWPSCCVTRLGVWKYRQHSRRQLERRRGIAAVRS